MNDITHLPLAGDVEEGTDADGTPILDVRPVPHSIRHATVFGALSAIRPGRSLILVAPHNPLPLLRQVADRENGAIEVTYLDEGTKEWRLRLTRQK